MCIQSSLTIADVKPGQLHVGDNFWSVANLARRFAWESLFLCSLHAALRPTSCKSSNFMLQRQQIPALLFHRGHPKISEYHFQSPFRSIVAPWMSISFPADLHGSTCSRGDAGHSTKWAHLLDSCRVCPLARLAIDQMPRLWWSPHGPTCSRGDGGQLYGRMAALIGTCRNKFVALARKMPTVHFNWFRSVPTIWDSVCPEGYWNKLIQAPFLQK